VPAASITSSDWPRLRGYFRCLGPDVDELVRALLLILNEAIGGGEDGVVLADAENIYPIIQKA